MKYRLYSLLTAIIALFALMDDTHAQENLPPGPSNYEEDLQIFAPFDLDLDNKVDDQWSGYFFEYNKLFWAYTGERTTIGDKNVSENINGVMVQGQFAEVIYQPGPASGGYPQAGTLGTEPPPYLVQNSLTNAGPRVGFALGNRYELGYRDGMHGWSISVLDGPTLNQNTTYGLPIRSSDGGTAPFFSRDYTDGSDVGVPTGTVGTTGPVGEARAFGFGAVPILFQTPPGYLQGFRDYLQNLAGAQGGTVAGPTLYVGNTGMASFNESGTTNTTTLPVFRLADDLNSNGVWGSAIVVNPDGTLGTITDFGDLHTFNIFFDQVVVRSQTNVDGVELMWTHDITNQNYMAKNQNNRLTLGYGARFLRLYDDFRVDAFGSILHDAYWDTSFDNDIVGPQIAAKWVNQRQRWRTEIDARFMAGFNIANWNQVGLMGEGLIPGALNQPLYGRPTAFDHGLRELSFSPVGELRLKSSYHFTSAFALNFGYTGTVMSNIRRAAPSVSYRLPDMGYVDAGGQTMLSNGFDLGVEFIH